MPQHPLARRTFSGTARKSQEAAPPAASLRTTALRLLSRRDYTRAELRDRLLERGYPHDDVNRTIEELIAGGSLDDRRVAAAHARTAVAVKGRGRYRVRRELQARGVAQDLADEALKGLDDESEAEAIKRLLARKRFPANPSLPERRRMIQHLLRRGYAADLIYRAIGRGHGEADDPSEA